ncbi:MAG: DegT/DnrJ/EryC1/StrS family aminotransferase [Myxococcales bacterium]|nr:DegT/DnrJ/EryC1/StrS family aminotransferase [Myxococcales bacterium]
MGWQIPIANLSAEYEAVGPAVEAAVLRVLRSNEYVLGGETPRFEAEMAELVGTDFAIGVGSGTEALALALRALGVGAGDEVVTTPFTFFATVDAILWVGARPVFGDIEADGFNLDAASLDAVITPRTRALLPVHLFGHCANLEAIRAVADAHDLPIVEDAAQAIGASRGGRPAGSFGDVGCFSFYPSKNLGAVGDAGCVTTNDAELAETLRALRIHGRDGAGVYARVGTTSRLDSVQAAALSAKLPWLKDWTTLRTRNAALFDAALTDCARVVLPGTARDSEPVWSQYTLRTPDPEAVRDALRDHGIEARRYYPVPAYREPALGDAMLCEGARPNAERACAEALSVPVHWSCSPDDIRYVAEVVHAAV